MIMTVYVIADIEITDDSWVADYGANVHDIVAKHGGEYLSRSGNIINAAGEGPNSNMIAIIKFPSVDAVQGFVGDPEYAPYGKAREDGSNSIIRIIDDTDVAGGIPYLPKG
jgi:uncharacterized protein (DUF1330 family)|tara:strand:- start:525 stop:857 length:333 start_codon:yes stop_codon:yes gene_type:complete